jgi:hypothetical protein
MSLKGRDLPAERPPMPMTVPVTLRAARWYDDAAAAIAPPLASDAGGKNAVAAVKQSAHDRTINVFLFISPSPSEKTARRARPARHTLVNRPHARPLKPPRHGHALVTAALF